MRNNAITGIGVCGAGYPNILALEHALRTGKSSIVHHGYFSECDFPSAQIGGICADIDMVEDLKSQHIDHELLLKAQKISKRRGLMYQAATSAVMQAWNQAGLFSAFYKPEEIAIIVAGQNLHLNEQYQTVKKFMKEPSYVNPGYAQRFIDTTLMSFLSEFFNIKGMGFHSAAATASGNIAIMEAIKVLDEQIKCCIVVGAMADLSPVELQAFYNSGALGGADYIDHPEKASRPFDTAHNGFIYGQGCGALVIETSENAFQRQQHVLAHIAAAATCLDACATTQPHCAGEIQVMQKALAQGNYPKIDYINAHGTGTPLGDAIEAQAISEVFQNKPYINATKALIGHTLWPSAIIECIACIIQLQGGFLHGNINMDNPIDPSLNFIGKNSIKAKITYAMSLAFGFGGINTAIIIKNAQGEYNGL